MLHRIRSDNNAVIDDIDVALLALDLDLIGALVGGPGQIDVAAARSQIESTGLPCLRAAIRGSGAFRAGAAMPRGTPAQRKTQ